MLSRNESRVNAFYAKFLKKCDYANIVAGKMLPEMQGGPPAARHEAQKSCLFAAFCAIVTANEWQYPFMRRNQS